MRADSDQGCEEALYQPARLPRPYGGFDEKDSPVVDAARTIARETATRVVQEMISELAKNDEFRQVMVDYMVAVLTGGSARQLA